MIEAVLVEVDGVIAGTRDARRVAVLHTVGDDGVVPGGSESAGRAAARTTDWRSDAAATRRTSSRSKTARYASAPPTGLGSDARSSAGFPLTSRSPRTRSFLPSLDSRWRHSTR